MKSVKFTIALCILLVTCGVQGLESSDSLSDRDWITWQVARFFEEIEENQIKMSIGRCSGVNATANFIQEVATTLEGVKEWEEKVANIPADPVVLSTCKFYAGNLTRYWEDYADENIECILSYLTGRGAPETFYDGVQDEIKEFENDLNNVMAQVEKCTDSSCLQEIRELVGGDITNMWTAEVLVSIGLVLQYTAFFEDMLQVCNNIGEMTQNAGTYYYEDIKLCVDQISADSTT